MSQNHQNECTQALFDSVDSVADDDLDDVMLIAGAMISSFLDADIAVLIVLGGACIRSTRTLFNKKRRQPGRAHGKGGHAGGNGDLGGRDWHSMSHTQRGGR